MAVQLVLVLLDVAHDENYPKWLASIYLGVPHPKDLSVLLPVVAHRDGHQVFSSKNFPFFPGPAGSLLALSLIHI